MENYSMSAEFAASKDKADELARYRQEFHFPSFMGKECVYFTGNSLGLQPKQTKDYIQQELDDWAKFGVEGHFLAKNPWFSYHEILTSKMAKIVGGKDREVVVTHSLTTNLHLLMVSFYRPEGGRYKILCEEKAFPSDQYALESQVKFHGYDPKDALVEVGPRDGEHTIRHEDIIKAIEEHGDEIALVMIGGVNYYTGQVFDMKSITDAGHKAGAAVGFDLAHGAGNIKLHLHDWNVDFAAWCTYKYLNSGPGGASGFFVHERHEFEPELPRFAGWWGYDKETRFNMEPGFVPMNGAEGWQLSNAPVISMAALNASLDLFDEVGMDKLRAKSDDLTSYLEFCINEVSLRNDDCDFEIITPKNLDERGAQLSILCHGQGKSLFEKLTEEGVIADWREPNVIRIAPTPLYNSYMDVYNFAKLLEKAIQ